MESRDTTLTGLNGKDTAKAAADLKAHNLPTLFSYRQAYFIGAEAQAEISFKAGYDKGFDDAAKIDKQLAYEAGLDVGSKARIKEVTGWLEICKRGGSLIHPKEYYQFEMDEWQAFLKEKGIE